LATFGWIDQRSRTDERALLFGRLDGRTSSASDGEVEQGADANDLERLAGCGGRHGYGRRPNAARMLLRWRTDNVQWVLPSIVRGPAAVPDETMRRISA
jgi:hypothetical protein